MEENNWRCPRCFKHVESFVAKCSCTLNRPSQQQENRGVDRYELHQTESQLQQQEQNILKNVNRIANKGKQEYCTNICDYGLTFKNYKNSCEESQCLPLTFPTFQESESSQSNSIYDANFSYPQESSKINKEPLNHQNFLPPAYFSQRQKKVYINSKELNDVQETTKNLEHVHEKYIHKKGLFLEKRNLNESIISNQKHNYDSSETFNIRELQPLEMQYQTKSILPWATTIHERPTSEQDTFQVISDQPYDLQSPFLGNFFHETNVSKDIFHFSSSDEYGSQGSNYRKNVFHAETREEYLSHNDTNTNNFAFPNPYFANEAPLPMSQHILNENIIENNSQQYQGNRNISEKINETYASQECIIRLTDPVQFRHAEAAFNDLCNQQSIPYSGENIFQRDFQTKYLDVNIKKTTFSNQYPTNEGLLPIIQQCLQENKFIRFTQEHQNNGMISKNLPDTFIIEKRLSTFPDPGDCIYTQKSRNYEDFRQSEILTSLNSIAIPRNNLTVDVEKKTHNVNKILLDLESNSSLQYNEHYENWNKCNMSTNIDGNESLCTSLNNEENIFQDYNHSQNLIQTSDISTRNSNLLINNKEEYLVNHMRTHANKWKKQCIICKRSFTRRTLLDNHMRIHTKERRYKCKFCQLSFTKKSTLVGHIRTHTNERPYQCKICQKTFTLKSTLGVHIRTHTNVRPYQCEICHKSFKQKSNLNTHIRTHANEKPYKCNICHKRFMRKEKLKQHMPIHTN
ncbi:unnamed protein product [Larinioides sclopetarius]|uniref:C2H2-type domain-containing protein n=1 Tax=Larinioides sclopetarius TaxID=280406 RepID=A0AAV2B5V2_9ARAC